MPHSHLSYLLQALSPVLQRDGLQLSITPATGTASMLQCDGL